MDNRVIVPELVGNLDLGPQSRRRASRRVAEGRNPEATAAKLSIRGAPRVTATRRCHAWATAEASSRGAVSGGRVAPLRLGCRRTFNGCP
jgi:hypothetical protein